MTEFEKKTNRSWGKIQRQKVSEEYLGDIGSVEVALQFPPVSWDGETLSFWDESFIGDFDEWDAGMIAAEECLEIARNIQSVDELFNIFEASRGVTGESFRRQLMVNLVLRPATEDERVAFRNRVAELCRAKFH
jgi:hypothetical protein